MPSKTFSQICRDIKSLKIQGATNIAKAGVKALSLKGASVKKLISLRPTEPCLRNALKYALKFGRKMALKHFDNANKQIIKYGYKKVGGVVFTHCHSTAVIDILKYAKQKGIKFEVYNTETRPNFQGRLTAKELAKAGIKLTMIVDEAVDALFEEKEPFTKCDIMFIGCDAILWNGDCINKIGSAMFAKIAFNHKIPIYICTDSWKFDPMTIKGKGAKREEIELRPASEIWKHAPSNILIKNPAFETVPAKFITGIISELGILKPRDFVKEVVKENKWMIN